MCDGETDRPFAPKCELKSLGCCVIVQFVMQIMFVTLSFKVLLRYLTDRISVGTRFSARPKPALRSTQPPVEWVPGEIQEETGKGSEEESLEEER